jgi:hypothetical protein
MLPLDKLVGFKGNKYILARAVMIAVDKVGNIKGYPEDDEKWKIVPNVLGMTLREELHYKYDKNDKGNQRKPI